MAISPVVPVVMDSAAAAEASDPMVMQQLAAVPADMAVAIWVATEAAAMAAVCRMVAAAVAVAAEPIMRADTDEMASVALARTRTQHK